MGKRKRSRAKHKAQLAKTHKPLTSYTTAQPPTHRKPAPHPPRQAPQIPTTDKLDLILAKLQRIEDRLNNGREKPTVPKAPLSPTDPTRTLEEIQVGTSHLSALTESLKRVFDESAVKIVNTRDGNSFRQERVIKPSAVKQYQKDMKT